MLLEKKTEDLHMGRASTKENKNKYQLVREALERISITVEPLQLRAERMLANGVIDAEAYNARKKQ